MNIIAVIAQFPVSLSVQRNLEVIDSVLEQTSAGDLVLFPEGAISGYSNDTAFLKQVNPRERRRRVFISAWHVTGGYACK